LKAPPPLKRSLKWLKMLGLIFLLWYNEASLLVRTTAKNRPY
jgi:hypothetical protein